MREFLSIALRELYFIFIGTLIGAALCIGVITSYFPEPPVTAESSGSVYKELWVHMPEEVSDKIFALQGERHAHMACRFLSDFEWKNQHPKKGK